MQWFPWSRSQDVVVIVILVIGLARSGDDLGI